MNAQSNTTLPGDCLKPTANSFLGKPLGFIHEDHLRECQICTILDEIAGNDVHSSDINAQVLSFLNNELPLHLEDEEKDLFPLLHRRCEWEDEMSNVIAILEDLVLELRELTQEERAILRDFASHFRRHLILENEIILPFARLRLTRRDLKTLYLRMCQRRGLDRLSGAQNAE